MTEKVRLQRYLASAGVAARRKAEELIVAGHVRVNGKQVRLLGSKVDPVRDHVTVNGEAVHPLDAFYVLLNKPKGCVTAVEDDRGRPTVMEYLPNLPIPVRPVGRLDFYAEGVVLLTNDGDLAARLVSTQRHIPKTYHVKVRGELRRDHLQALREGVRLDDGSTSLPAEINHLPGESRHSWLAVTVIENKQHQVQRMMEALGYQVQKLQCVAFGNLTYHGLRVGDARELTQLELNALRDLVELDHSAGVRGVWRTYREDTDIPRRAREKLRAEAAEEDSDDAPIPSDWQSADALSNSRQSDRPPRGATGRPSRGTADRPSARLPRGATDRPPRGAARPTRGAADRPSRGPADSRRSAAGQGDLRAPTEPRRYDRRGPAPPGRPPERPFGKPRSSTESFGSPRPSRPSERSFGESRARPSGESRSPAPAGRSFGKPRSRSSSERSFGEPRLSRPSADRPFGKPRSSERSGDSRTSAPTGRSFGKPRSSAPSADRPEPRRPGGPPRPALRAESARPSRAGQGARPNSPAPRTSRAPAPSSSPSRPQRPPRRR